LTTVPLLAQNNLAQEFSDRLDKIVVESIGLPDSRSGEPFERVAKSNHGGRSL
jgi:hypothetical protein